MKQKSNCLTLEDGVRAFHSAASVHEERTICLRRDCKVCQSLNAFIVKLGDECEERGCTPERCVNDPA